MSEPVDLQTRRLVKALFEVYNVQMEHFFADQVMPGVIERLGLSDEEAIQMLEDFIERGWLKTQNFKTRYFLRPGYVRSFPVIISSSGLQCLKQAKP